MFFYLFSFLLILASLGVVISKNHVHSVLWLIFALLNSAGLFVLLGAEFLAMMTIIVYVGAVAVLFLFVIMMIDIHSQQYLKASKSFLTAILTFTFFIAIAWLLHTNLKDKIIDQVFLAQDNVIAIADVLYTKFIVPVEVSGVILLGAIIGAIVLTDRDQRPIKKQNISQQVSRSKTDCIKMVNIANNSAVKGINYDL